MEVDKENFRMTTNRVAAALKRERERSSVVARQELEQLRLEFLAREERYVLDGDRSELLRIRRELHSLKTAPEPQSPSSVVVPAEKERDVLIPPPPASGTTDESSSDYYVSDGVSPVDDSIPIDSKQQQKRHQQHGSNHISLIMSSGLYDDDPEDPLLRAVEVELDKIRHRHHTGENI